MCGFLYVRLYCWQASDFKRFFSCVSSHVTGHTTDMPKTFTTNITLIRFYACVKSHVPGEKNWHS